MRPHRGGDGFWHVEIVEYCVLCTPEPSGRRSVDPEPIALTARFSYINPRRLDYAEAEAIRRAMAAGGHLGVQVRGARPYVAKGDWRFEGSSAFSEAPGVAGFVDPAQPGYLSVLVGSRRAKSDIALAVLHEMRHLAQIAHAPAIYADHEAAEAEARAYAADAADALVAGDRWFATT